MIKRVNSPEELLLPEKGVEAQKIRALLLAYGTGYDFCRFYTSENLAFCEMNGSFVLCENGNCDFEELARFLAFHGFSEIFCSKEFGERLAAFLNCGFKAVNLMIFCGSSLECSDVEKNPPLGEIYKILSKAFAFDYEPWYVDMSHRIRHGIAQVRKLDGSALTIQHNLNEEALLSQIATVPEKRGRGTASRLILSACAELSLSKVFVICENGLLPFYEKIGFEKIDEKIVLTRN